MGLVEIVETSGRHPNPTRRVGEPEEIAAIALYLASGAGGYATGQTRVVDSGELVFAPDRSKLIETLISCSRSRRFDRYRYMSLA